MSDSSGLNQKWALIIGGSSGIGFASAEKLTKQGWNLIIVHKDRKSAERTFQENLNRIKNDHNHIKTINADGVKEESVQGVLEIIKEELEEEGGKLGLILHSIANGNVKRMIPPVKIQNEEEGVMPTKFASVFQGQIGPATLTVKDMEYTVSAMGISLFTWVKGLLDHQLFDTQAKVLALTSEGDKRIWAGYGAVSAAKSVLESVIKYLAVELAPYHITANLIQAGVTETPSFKMIPGSNLIKELTLQRNPYHRLTTPADVANVVALLARPEANWINGDTIIVDGGEHLR
ncbi:MAG: SDR family oxidoreductase [Bacteroidota bacterium]